MTDSQGTVIAVPKSIDQEKLDHLFRIETRLVDLKEVLEDIKSLLKHNKKHGGK